MIIDKSVFCQYSARLLKDLRKDIGQQTSQIYGTAQFCYEHQYGFRSNHSTVIQ